MDAIVSQIQEAFEGQIDFEGQRLADLLSTVMLSITAFIALMIGLFTHDIHLVVWIGLVGTLLTMLVVVPAWPFYNQNPQSWIGSRLKGAVSHGGTVSLKTS